MRSSNFSRILALSLALFFPPTSSLGQSIIPESELYRYEPVKRTYQKSNTNNIHLINPTDPREQNPFSSRPELRPVESTKIFYNRFGERVGTTFSYSLRF
jgi:hypothetical protein